MLRCSPEWEGLLAQDSGDSSAGVQRYCPSVMLLLRVQHHSFGSDEMITLITELL
jgi:hypothetical protein